MINIRMQEDINRLRPKITVIGVGGGGNNAINNMISSGLEGCEFLACNTDAQALENSLATQKIQLGAHVTRGLGAGANPDIGRAATEESLDEIMDYLEGTNMVFITAGMGGGTGTGSAPVVAQAAREQGILTVGVVTKPFHFEGTTRMKLAESGIDELQKYVDTLIVIPNQNLFRIANEKTTFADAFKLADEVLQSGVRGVTDLMVMPGLINLDFADIRAVMAEMGKAMMGTGEAEGERRAIEAAEAAIANPLLDDVSMKGARGVLINITGGSDMTLFEVDEAANRIRDEVDPNANIIFGSTFLDELEGRMRVSIVATGIEVEGLRKPIPTAAGLSVVGGIAASPRREESADKDEERREAGGGLRSAPAVRSTGTSRDTATGFAGATPSIRPEIAARVMTAPHQTSPLGRPTASAKDAPQHPAAAKPSVQQPEPGSYSYSPYPAQTSAATARKENYRAPTVPPALPPITPTKAAQRQEQERQGQQQPYQTSLRGEGPELARPQGQRTESGYIPPSPVVPTSARSGDLFATAEASKAETAVPKPTVKPSAAPTKAAPSLFERFTGKGADEDRQGHFSVQQGGKTESGEDELDIPAFLRRQAN